MSSEKAGAVSEPTLSRRDRQAQQTRADILRAARHLFAERGYARTTVRNIADDAADLRLLVDQEAEIGRIVGESMASGDPAVLVATSARVSRSIVEHCGDIVQALVTGAAAEPELAEALTEGHRRHVGGAQGVARALRKAGALAVDVDDAAQTMAALSDVTLCLLLRDSYGWSLDRIETWIIDTTRTLLLAPSVDR